MRFVEFLITDLLLGASILLLGLSAADREGGGDAGMLQVVLGRPARVLILAPYVGAFTSAIDAALAAAAPVPGSPLSAATGAAPAADDDGERAPLTCELGLAGRSGASLLLHCHVTTRLLPASDVSNLFASSPLPPTRSSLHGTRLVRFIATGVSLLGPS